MTRFSMPRRLVAAILSAALIGAGFGAAIYAATDNHPSALAAANDRSRGDDHECDPRPTPR